MLTDGPWWQCARQGLAGVVVRTIDAITEQPEPVDPITRAEVQELLLDTATRVDPAQLGKAGQRAGTASTPRRPSGWPRTRTRSTRGATVTS
jgi:hypothetical protein